jgi:ankyrin repeat protein
MADSSEPSVKKNDSSLNDPRRVPTIIGIRKKTPLSNRGVIKREDFHDFKRQLSSTINVEDEEELAEFLLQLISFRASIEKMEYVLQLGANPDRNVGIFINTFERLMFWYKSYENVLDYIKLFLSYGKGEYFFRHNSPSDKYRTGLDYANEYNIPTVVGYLSSDWKKSEIFGSNLSLLKKSSMLFIRRDISFYNENLIKRYNRYEFVDKLEYDDGTYIDSFLGSVDLLLELISLKEHFNTKKLLSEFYAKVEFLLTIESDFNHKIEGTPIMEIVLYFLKNDKDVLKYIKLFISHGGNPKTTNSYGETLLDVAEKHNILGVVEYLSSSKVEFDINEYEESFDDDFYPY